MNKFNIKEFRPTLLFLGKFLGLYLVSNLLYGAYVTHFEPRPDPVTRWVSDQTGMVLTACGWPVETKDHPTKATTLIIHDGQTILSVYEGCNGLNTAIIFVAFLLAFGPINKSMAWFVPAGLIIIHLANLLRIGLLFFVSQHYPGAMYFVHKYVFTGSLYLIIFLLWVWWVKKFSLARRG